MLISEEVKSRLVQALWETSSHWYDDPHGAWGFECPFCLMKSTDGSSSPPHADDCEAMLLIKILEVG